MVANLWLTFMVGTAALILTPEKHINNLKPLVKFRKMVRSYLYRPVGLTMRGPFFRWFVKFVKNYGGSYFYSDCMAPIKVTATSTGACEVELKWKPVYPFNPCHEEHYAVAWAKANEQVKEGAERTWRELEFIHGDYAPVDEKKTDDQGRHEKFKLTVDGLPEYTSLKFRICAVGKRGRGPWSKEIDVETLAPPDEFNGFIGAIGDNAPCEGKRSVYNWFQSKHEVGMRIPLPEDWKPKQLRVKATATKLDVRYVPDPATPDDTKPVISGPLGSKIKPDELFWECEENEKEGWHLHIVLRKAELMEKWPCILQGDAHPKVDVKKLRLGYEGNLMTELGCHDLWE